MNRELIAYTPPVSVDPVQAISSHSVYSVHDLYNKYVERKHKNHEIYRTIVYDVFKRIEERDNKGGYNLLYNVPILIYGNTRYKVATCINYLMSKISKAGFIILPYANNSVYIDWSIVKTMTDKTKTKTKKVHFCERAKIMN